MHVIILIVVLLLAAYLRFSQLDYATLGPGEVEIYEAAKDYASGNILKSFYIFDTPPMPKYLGALMLIIFGFSESALRLIPAIFGIATVLLTYLFAKKFYNKNTGLLAASFVAFSFIHIQFSRYFQLEVMLSFFFLMAFYYFFDFTENRKKNYALFGIAVALGLLTKFIMIYALVSIILISIIYRHVSFRRRPQFSVTMDNFLLKALIVAVVLFFAIWPHSLMPIKTDITLSVDFSDGPHVNHITPSIPQLFLALGKRSVSAQQAGVLALPLGYSIFFLVKENILFILAFIAGLIFVLKKPKKIDKMILLSLLVFMLLLWAQRWGFTYRYLVIIVPFLAIIAARWIDGIKSNMSIVAIGAIVLLLFGSALAVHPSYIFHQNFQYTESELYQAEGMKESIAYINENCSVLYTDSYYHFILAPYYNNSVKYLDQTRLPTCVLTGYTKTIYSAPGSENFIMEDFINTHSCELRKTVEKYDVVLQQIYYCS